ncbi:hypothetical protein E4U53_002722 [Claviceps sorghi]|nr:hypothetical protein E4U53_002722 [Claviceps sorghi]
MDSWLLRTSAMLATGAGLAETAETAWTTSVVTWTSCRRSVMTLRDVKSQQATHKAEGGRRGVKMRRLRKYGQ